MVVLARELTDEAAAYLGDIEKNLERPIFFYPIEQYPRYRAGRLFGIICTKNNCHEVHIDTSLDRHEFESTVLHEAGHALQVEQDDTPAINCKESARTAEAEELVLLIQSTIMDFEVEQKLVKLECHTDLKLRKSAMALFQGNTQYITKDNLLSYGANVVQMARLVLLANLESTSIFSDEIQQNLLTWPSFFCGDVEVIVNHVVTTDVTSGKGKVSCYGKIVNVLGLWKTILIYYGDDKKIRTEKEYDDFESHYHKE